MRLGARWIHDPSAVATVTAVHLKDLWFICVWWLRIRSHAALPYIHALIGLLCVLGKSLSFSVPPTPGVDGDVLCGSVG